MSNKSYGLAYERKEKKHLLEVESCDMAMRCRGSFGVFDIIAFKDDMWIVTSVKSSKKGSMSLKQEWAKIKSTKVPKNTIKRLVVYLKGKRKVLLEVQENLFLEHPF